MSSIQSWATKGLASLAATVAFLPSGVLAGTEAYPEWGDVLGDQVPVSPVTRDLDMLAAWFHDETDAELQITLKVNELTTASRNVYELRWNFMPRFGVRVELGSPDPRWVVLSSGEPDGPMSEIGEVSGQLRLGAPGYLTWLVPKEEAGWRDRTVFWRQGASSNRIDALQQALPASDYMGPANMDVYQVGQSQAVKIGNVSRPARSPTMQSLLEPDLPDEHDVLGFWYERDASFVNLTFEVRGLPLDRKDGCRNWELRFIAGTGVERDDLHQFESKLHVYFGPPGPQYVGSYVQHQVRSDTGQASIESRSTNLPVMIQPGSPTLVHQSIPQAEWKLVADYPGRHAYSGIHVSGGCLFTEFDQFPTNHWKQVGGGSLANLPATSFPLLFVVFVAIALVRKMGPRG